MDRIEIWTDVITSVGVIIRHAAELAIKCPLCVANGIYTEYAFEDMEGDHIIPWSKGGHTTDNNLQMLCKKCNAAKSDN